MKRPLPPYREPAPKPRRACAACQAFAPECLVPVGESSAPMCWLCAHAIVEHDCPVGEAFTHECECPPQAIYPHRMFETPGHLLAAEPEAPTPSERERSLEELLRDMPPGDPTGQWIREAHKQMSKAQHDAVRRRLGKSVPPVAEDRARRKTPQ